MCLLLCAVSAIIKIIILVATGNETWAERASEQKEQVGRKSKWAERASGQKVEKEQVSRKSKWAERASGQKEQVGRKSK